MRENVNFMSNKFKFRKVLKTNYSKWSSKIMKIALIMLIISILDTNVFYLLAFVSLSGIAWLTSCIQLTWGKSKIENRSDKTVFVKLKYSNDVIPLEKDVSIYDVEGIKFYNTVFKIEEGVHVAITEKYELEQQSFFEKLIHRDGNCVVAPPDESWENLFNANS